MSRTIRRQQAARADPRSTPQLRHFPRRHDRRRSKLDEFETAHRPVAGTLSSDDGHADLRGTEDARIRAAATRFFASVVKQLRSRPQQAAGRAVRNGPRRAGANGLGRISDRLHAGRPSSGELVQLPAGLLATTVSLLYRATGLRDDGRPAHLRPSTTCKAWRRRACTTT